MDGLYFLTDLQETFKNQIKLHKPTPNTFVSIVGSAGTGKTLLTYDLVKEYIKAKKKVLIFHCGNLNSGHSILINSYNWTIAPIKK
jgi:Cdc6-like AAA superfamily ATPase